MGFVPEGRGSGWGTKGQTIRYGTQDDKQKQGRRYRDLAQLNIFVCPEI